MLTFKTSFEIMYSVYDGFLTYIYFKYRTRSKIRRSRWKLYTQILGGGRNNVYKSLLPH